jgi:PAS domain S-box-containing protein
MSKPLSHEDHEMPNELLIEKAEQGLPLTLLKKILDNIPDPVFVKDCKHRWLYLNHAFCDFVGFSAHDMLGKTEYEFFPKEQVDVFWAMDDLVFDTNTKNRNVEQIKTAHSDVRTIATQKILYTDDQGRKLLVGTIRDISELHRLQTHEKQINRVLKELALGGPHEQILKMILLTAEEQFDGMTASLLVTDQAGERLYQAVPSRLPEYFCKAIEGTPVRDEMGSCGTAAYRRKRVIAEDLQNHPYWQRVKGLTERAGLRACWSEPIIASNGNLVGTFALYYSSPRVPNGTEIKLMETMAQLAAIALEHHRINEEAIILRRLLGNIIDSMPSMLIGVDAGGMINLWNQEAENRTGIAGNEALGKKLEVLQAELGEGILNVVYTAIGRNEVQPLLRNARESRGEKIYEDITIFPLRSNSAEGAVIRIDDVTERVRSEESMIQTERLMSVGVLAGGIAHDFNNILVGILGNLNLATRYIKHEDTAYELLRKAEDASLRAKGLANQLLTFAKGSVPLRQVANLDGLIRESTKFILSGSNITCEFDIPDDLWTVNIDKDQISQVVQNLVINAKQEMIDGGVISIRCANVSRLSSDIPPILKGERYVFVEIEDQGPGISPEVIHRIFDPYFTTKTKGSGLGLAVCYSIINKHEGYITAGRSAGTGALFIFYLPAAEKNVDIQEPEASLVKLRKTLESGKILVMDDEEIVCDLTGDMLEFLGYEAHLVHDGSEAVTQYLDALQGAAPFDAVIMDLTVPAGMGGKEAVCEILDKHPQAKVIVSSGYSHDPIIAKFREYGFSAAIVKPFRLKELADALTSVMQG